MNGIEWLLTRRVRHPEDHPNNFEWWFLDLEIMHQEILHLLINASPPLCRALFGHDGKCVRCGSLFDLVVRGPAGAEDCVEIKTFDHWRAKQRARQIRYVQQEPQRRRGWLILLAKTARAPVGPPDDCLVFTTERVKNLSEGCFTKVTCKDLCRALSFVQGDPSVREVAQAYKLALEQQEQRAAQQWASFPNE